MYAPHKKCKAETVSATCCGGNAKFEGLDPLYRRRLYRRRLWAVIAINAAMFAIELTAGVIAGSQALQADALDFLGDTLTYGISLAVIGMGLRVRAAVMVAAAGVWQTATAWPDLIVASIMGGLFLWSSIQILQQGWTEYRQTEMQSAVGKV